MSKVVKQRTCGECRRTFVSPDGFIKHKYKFGGCRSEEGLKNSGFILTDKGWRYVPKEVSSGDSGSKSKSKG